MDVNLSVRKLRHLPNCLVMTQLWYGVDTTPRSTVGTESGEGTKLYQIQQQNERSNG